MASQVITFPKPMMGYHEAMEAGRKAAAERCRKAGRTKWSQDDYNEAVRTFDRLHGKAFRAAIGVPEINA